MADGYGNYRTGAVDGTLPTPKKIPGAVNGAPRRSFTEIFDMSKANVQKVATNRNFVARIPAGHALQSITVHSTVSLTTSQLSFGDGTTANLFGAAAAYGTTPEAALSYLRVSKKGVILDVDTDIWMTTTVADLPAAGTVVVEVNTSAKG
jgi:hypothetical protein